MAWCNARWLLWSLKLTENTDQEAGGKAVVIIQKFQGHYRFHIVGFSKSWTICGVYCMWDEEPTCCGCLTTSRLHTETGSGASWRKCQTCPLACGMKGAELTVKGSVGQRFSLHAGTTASSANSAVIMHGQTCPIGWVYGGLLLCLLCLSPSVAVSEPHLLLMQQSRKKRSKHPGCS